MTRSVRLTEDDLRILEQAARLASTLGAVERAHALGEPMSVEAILGGVDPVDVRIVAAHLRELAALWHRSPVRIGAEPTPEGTDGGSPVRRLPPLASSAPKPLARYTRTPW